MWFRLSILVSAKVLRLPSFHDTLVILKKPEFGSTLYTSMHLQDKRPQMSRLV